MRKSVYNSRETKIESESDLPGRRSGSRRDGRQMKLATHSRTRVLYIVILSFRGFITFTRPST